MSAELYDPKSPYYDPTLGFDAQLDLSDRKYDGFGASDIDRRDMEAHADMWAVVMPVVELTATPAKIQNVSRLESAYTAYWADVHEFTGTVNAEGLLRDEVRNTWEWFVETDDYGREKKTRGEKRNCFAGSVGYTMGRDLRDMPSRPNAIYEPWNWDASDPEFYPVAALVVLDGAAAYTDFEAYVHVFRHRDLRVVPQSQRQNGGRIVNYEAHSVPADYNWGKQLGPEFWGVYRYFEKAEQGFEWLAEQRQAVIGLSRALRTAHEPEPFPTPLTVEEVHGSRPRGTR